MDYRDALDLTHYLQRADGRIRGSITDDRIEFTGGGRGAHSIDMRMSSKERVLAHWQGYLEANGVWYVPTIGMEVRFPSKSAPGGWRRGTVIAVGRSRAKVAFHFKHGGKSERDVPFYMLRSAW